MWWTPAFGGAQRPKDAAAGGENSRFLGNIRGFWTKSGREYGSCQTLWRESGINKKPLSGNLINRLAKSNHTATAFIATILPSLPPT